MEKSDSLVLCKHGFENRRGEAVINLVSTLTGAAWRLMEDFHVTTAGKEGTFEQILKVLDQHFEYDRVSFQPTSMPTLACLGSQDNP